MPSKRTKPIASKAVRKAASLSSSRKAGLSKAGMTKSGDIKLSKILSQLRKRDKVMLSTVEQMRLALESVLLVMHSNQERLLKLESEWLKCTMPVSPHLPQSVN